MIRSILKWVLKATVFREGAIRTVLWGPCRGMKYRIFPGYGWAYIYGGWEPDVAEAFKAHVRPAATVYDIGANYGMHTLLLSRLVGANGLVYAFEPNPLIARSLREQLDLNKLVNVKTVEQALSNETGEAWFQVDESSATGHLSQERGSFRVEVTTLDDFVFRDGHKPPDLLKVDIEGAESRMLKGGMIVLERFRPVMIIELHNPTEDKAVGEILEEYNYRAFRIDDGSEVRNLRSGWPDKEGMYGTVLCLPKVRIPRT